MAKWDIVQKVKLCEKHNKFYTDLVLGKMSDGTICIQPIFLCKLLEESGVCTECEWSVTFPSLKTLKLNSETLKSKPRIRKVKTLDGQAKENATELNLDPEDLVIVRGSEVEKIVGDPVSYLVKQLQEG